MNPLKAQRELVNLSQQSLALKSDVSSQYILRLEQGLLTSPPYDVLKVLVNPGPPYHDWLPPVAEQESIGELEVSYRDWQLGIRKSNLPQLRDAVIIFAGSPEERDDQLINQFPRFRSLIHESKIGFCKLYCIHPQVLTTFESKPRRHFTEYLRNVWVEAGLAEGEITMLEENL